MLSGEPNSIDLLEIKSTLSEHVPENLKQYICDDNSITNIKYPVLEYPTKIKSLKLEKLHNVEGVLKGIKGQYLIFEDGHVFNVRSHEGFVADFSVSSSSSQSSLF